jgi:benzodiazapine receptor
MTVAMVLAALWGVVVAGAGAALTRLGPWYYAMRRPSFQPPDWAFGPAWTIILGLGSYAAWLGWEQASSPGLRRCVAVQFALNGVLNILWSELFFRRRRPDWALREVPLLWLSILGLIITLWPIAPAAALCVVPYLIWVSFAAVLNRAIVALNRPFAGRAVFEQRNLVP